MDSRQLRKATVMTLALIVERLFAAVSAGDHEETAQQLVLLERGASLLLASISNEGQITEDFIQKLRDELAEALNDDSMDDILPDVLKLNMPSPPDDPRLN